MKHFSINGKRRTIHRYLTIQKGGLTALQTVQSKSYKTSFLVIINTVRSPLIKSELQDKLNFVEKFVNRCMYLQLKSKKIPCSGLQSCSDSSYFSAA